MRVWPTAVLAAALSACGGDSGHSGQAEITGVIEGTVTYRERMLIPPEAMVQVQLEDISRADAMATVMETVTLPADSGPPFAFSLGYDPARIDPRMRYALRATITLGERLLFTTTEYIDPFAGNPVEIMLYRVAEPVSHSPP